MAKKRMKSRIDQIIKLMQKEADALPGTDPAGKLYYVSREIDGRIEKLMEEVREKEREAS